MIDWICWIFGVYFVVAILLSASMVICNKGSLKPLSWNMLILFAFSPFLALRELIEKKRENE